MLGTVGPGDEESLGFSSFGGCRGGGGESDVALDLGEVVSN